MNLKPNWCVMCIKNEEDRDHLFLYCSYATATWGKIRLMLKWNFSLIEPPPFAFMYVN